MIETPRLLLRRYRPQDADDLLAVYTDPEVIRFIADYGNLDRGAILQRIEADEHEWTVRGHRHLAVVERSGGRLLGRVAVVDWEQFGETEIGWVLGPWARRHGYATEAGAACATWAFAHLPVPYVTAMIRPDNGPSLAVARRLGMEPLREDDLNGTAVIVQAVTRERWREAQAARGWTIHTLGSQ